ncbi:MAG TPA: DUF3667 domain-containing protein [Steroidobacteraceae bacterium]|nr:DUF3667 domain-containing protein [Steroidobacteraceae bacterium]
MSADIEAAGDAITGAIIAKTVEGQSAGPHHQASSHACLNCGAQLTGSYCANCGQAAHLHRTLHSLTHDILHGVFHFEGKFWSTLPQLFFFPGRLTRRYISGERAKFVSPMALFLFTVFTMFAVFSVTTSSLSGADANAAIGSWKQGNQRAMDTTDEKIDRLEAQLEQKDLTGEQQKAIETQIADLKASRKVMEALARGDWAGVREAKEEQARSHGQDPATARTHLGFTTGWAALDKRLEAGIDEANENPALLMYKLKTSGYKFSWMLIPLSIPFIWLLFFWRRDLPLYDHAIFATYSITFMMLLVTFVSVLAYAGAPAWIWGLLLTFAPPIHMYKQLRGAYLLSRAGATIRMFFLSIFSSIVLSIFTVLLLIMDVIG